MISLPQTRLSVRASEDLLELWLYVAESNPTAADRILDNIERVVGLLAENPRMGRERSELLSGIRSFAVVPWVIFYRVEPDQSIMVARIIHGARDLDDIDY